METAVTCQQKNKRNYQKPVIVTQTNLLNEVLLNIGVPPNIHGYQFIVKSLELIMENEEYMHSVTKGLYIDVAAHFRTKPTCVERAIRHAILTTWLYGDQEQINNIFKHCIKPGREVPSNSVFLARLYYYICSLEYRR